MKFRCRVDQLFFTEGPVSRSAWYFAGNGVILRQAPRPIAIQGKFSPWSPGLGIVGKAAGTRSDRTRATAKSPAAAPFLAVGTVVDPIHHSLGHPGAGRADPTPVS